MHLVRLVHKTVGAEEICSFLCIAVPVLGAVEQIWIPAVTFSNADVIGMMVVWTAVSRALTPVWNVFFAVLVAFVANQAIATVNTAREVTLDEIGVVLKILPVLGVAHHVGSVPSGTVPVLPAVELVGVPAVHLVRAVHEVAAVFSSGCVTSVVAVVVALVTDRTLSPQSVYSWKLQPPKTRS